VTTPEPELVGRVRATGLIDGARPLVVMLSGGRDSVCLLDVAVRIAGADQVRALHVNYGLRDAESDEDEHSCVALCEQLGVRLVVEWTRRPDDAGNLQAWARDVRYAAGVRECAKDGALLAAAHTQSDQIETVLYRLATSPGRQALLGMPASSGSLVRPLLAAGVTREETTAWCRKHGRQWRDDRSNVDANFARVRVREELVPAFLAVDPRAEANIVRTVGLLRDEAEALDAVVAELLGPRRDRIGQERLAGFRRGSQDSCCAGSPRRRPARIARGRPAASTRSWLSPMERSMSAMVRG